MRRKHKKPTNLRSALHLCIALAMLCCMAACAVLPAAGAGERTFTDSLGREVSLPAQITKVAPSGSASQMVLFALCPDLLVGTSSPWEEQELQFIPEKYHSLPAIGQLYGGKGDLNLEVLMDTGAQVIVDIGQAKDGAAEEMDALQAQTGIPVVHISSDLATMGDTYRMLGELLSMESEAGALADYCERVYARAETMCESVDKVGLIYVTGSKGLNVIARGSYHAQLIDMFSDNLAILEDPSSKGSGNEVDMEQILLWDPPVVIFAPGSIYHTVPDDPAWQNVQAIKNGAYYEPPLGPYNWMGSPPSVQRYLGIMWLGATLYPQAADYDLQQEVTEYFRLFYHCELSPQQYEALLQP